MRLHITGLFALAAVAMAALPAGAQTNPFAGAWNITPEAPASGVFWLEVKDEGGKPAEASSGRKSQNISPEAAV